MPVQFFNEDLDFQPEDLVRLNSWIQEIALSLNKEIADLNYIFCSDNYLLGINKQYLNHDYYTDIITFDNSEEEGTIEGDIFISIDRVMENAASLGISFEQEFCRVLAHGVLHLVGFNDKTDTEKKVMTEKEEACLSLLNK